MSKPKLVGFIVINLNQNRGDLSPLIMSTPKLVVFIAIYNVNTQTGWIYRH